MQHSNTAGCILLKFYIKPQHTANVYNLLYVVSYRNSTSNHNFFSRCYGNLEVVSYRNSTSNHNTLRRFLPAIRVVSYRNSTSNHNGGDCATCDIRVVSYRNSTSNHNGSVDVLPGRPVVSYRNSTSNHNWLFIRPQTFLLYLIEILHQTTTFRLALFASMGLYLIEILHQTTTETPRNSQCWRCILSKFYIKPQLLASKVDNNRGCILSKFYIKPQLVAMPLLLNMVVSYRNSTSNHNCCMN